MHSAETPSRTNWKSFASTPIKDPFTGEVYLTEVHPRNRKTTPSPTQPKSSTNRKESSITFRALRETIPEPTEPIQQPPPVKPFSLPSMNLEPPRKPNPEPDEPPQQPLNLFALSNDRESKTLSFQPNLDLTSLWSSPSGTTSTTTSMVYDHKEIETIRNQLMHTLVDNCKNINLAKISQLGQLRLADELQVSTGENNTFFQKILYLFEHYILVWNHHDYFEKPRIIPIRDTKIAFEGSILQILQTTGDYPYVTMLKSSSSAIIEKWVVALSDHTLPIPGELITTTLKSDSSVKKWDKRTSIPSTIQDVASLDSDIDSDQEIIEGIIQDDVPSI
ncbi:hypothetical protein JA1_003496 [Spathaspora sp. JA1]|nr:hypothetical protein JA1_003496 [Spathaspora sp. JA1]